MKGWLKGALIGFGISIIGYIVMIGLKPDVFPFSSLNNIWMILFALFPLIFITALGALIGSWISFGKEKSQSGEWKKESTGLGVAGFVLGLLSIILLKNGGLFAIIGLIFCSIQIKRNKTKLAIAGLILSIIGLIISVILFIISVIAIRNLKAGLVG